MSSQRFFTSFGLKTMFLILTVVIAAHSTLGEATAYHQNQQQQASQDTENTGGPANYMFKYAIQAGQYDNDFGHEEERNGQQTRGQYRVKLPDGRTQIVTYTADENGYKAKVTYQPSSSGGSSGGGGGGYGGSSQSSHRSSPSDSYGASSNNVNQNVNAGVAPVGGYVPPPQNKFQSQRPSQGYGTPAASTNSWQNSASGSNSNAQRSLGSLSSGSGSYMMQRRQIDGKTYSFETKY